MTRVLVVLCIFGLITDATAVCPANTFAFTDSTCLPVPPNAVSDTGSQTWRCGDGSVGTYGLRRIETSCSNYTFSNTLNNNPPCSVFASGGPNEGSNNPSDPSGNAGWCVSCSIAGNCPGAWAKLDLGEVTNVAGLRVAGRTGSCNYPTSFNALYSVDGITWTDVEFGKVFQLSYTRTIACGQGFADFLMYKPMKQVLFSAPVTARYVKVYPLTREGSTHPESYAAFQGWFMCMTFEALGVSEMRSPIMLMYPFTSQSSLQQSFGSLVTDVNTMALSSSGTWINGGGVNFKVGEYMLSPWIDFSLLNEFTLTFWINTQTFYSDVIFGLQQSSDNSWFFSTAPVYGTSFWKVNLGPNKFNGYGWGQEPYGKNMIVLHGRRSGGKTYFYTGQLGALGAGPLGASNGMSNYYEFFDMPWPKTLRMSLGSAGHRHNTINIKDIRLYRDGAVDLAPSFVNGPSSTFPYLLDSCAVCQPGFYCINNQQYACQANSSAGYHASSLSQCICYEGLLKENGLCRPCKAGYYCPNQTAEIPCSGNCSGFTYLSSACTSSKDRVCTQCPSTIPLLNSTTPAACICGSGKYNNGSGGCTTCPINTVSPTISYGKESCTCISGYISSQVYNNITNTSDLFCKLCGDNTYSIANTKVCFDYPSNSTVVSWSPGFVCPAGYWLAPNVPIRINTTTGYPDRPGLIYWNFDNEEIVNLWGEYNIRLSPALYFPRNTTADIQSLSPGLNCKFGASCLLAGGMFTDNYKYTLNIPDISMTSEGISVSFWLRINTCSGCGIYTFHSVLNQQLMWKFAGVEAMHTADTNYGLALRYFYNGIGSDPSGWRVFGGQYQIAFENFRNVWHHHLFVFKPEGRLLGYLDGNLLINTDYGKAFPLTFTGSFFPNKYFSSLVDDFAIFRGDISPYIANLQTNPANLIFNGVIGISNGCIPCSFGTYCSNNTFQSCAANKYSLMRSQTLNDCICSSSGSYGKGLEICTLCPTSSYCEGGGFDKKSCTGNYYSYQGSSKPRDCLCLSPFTVDSNGTCGCMAPFTKTNVTGSGQSSCECGAGYTGLINNLTEDSIINPIAGCGSAGAACSATIAVGRVYGGSFSSLIDGDPCSSMFIWGGPYKIVIDLGKIHFIKSISFIPGQSCTASYMYRTNSMEISTSADDNNNGFFAWHADTYDSNTPLRTFQDVPPIMRFARYIILSGVSPLYIQNTQYSDFFSLSELKVTAYPSPCTQCPAGFYCPNYDINNMLPCTIGHYCPAGSVQPLDCGNLAFSSVIGASQCTSCPVNSYTTSTTATSLSECRCSPGYSGVANMLAPELQMLNWTQPVSATLFCRGVNGGDLSKLYDKIGLNSQNANYPACRAQNAGADAYVQYDMGSIIPISKVVANPYANGYAYPYSSIRLSKTGMFNGEETEIFYTTCDNIASCPAPAVTSVGYIVQMFPVEARYVRWYLNFGDTTNWQQLAVYKCLGPTCYSCPICPYHSYCPGNFINDTSYPCANNTYTFADEVMPLNKTPPIAISQSSKCSCPLHSSLIAGNCVCDLGYISINDTTRSPGWKCLSCPVKSTMQPGTNYCACDFGYISSVNKTSPYGWSCILCANNSMMLPNNNYCSCNAGYYKTSNKDPVYGWQCDLCPSQYTSKADSVNISSCFCGKGLTGIENNTGVFKKYGTTSVSSSVFGTTSTLYDGIANWEYWNLYVYDSGASCTGRIAWVQYDMGSIGLIQDVYTLPYADGRLYCKWSIQISNTGAFNGEQTVVYSCGYTTGTYCPGGVRGAAVFTKFPPILGRYVRWYIGGSNSGNGAYFVQFLVNFGPPCTICTLNSFCPSTTPQEKYICPNNTYTASVGSTNLSQCICPGNASVRSSKEENKFNCSCDSGYYYTFNVNALLAGWQCDQCPVGRSSYPGSTNVAQCTCAAGYYPTNLPSKTACTLCPASNYCQFNTDYPTFCPAGFTSLAGSSSCDLPCPAGFFCPGNGTQMQCPAGTYTTGSAGLACTKCEAGHYCNATTSITCPSGTFCPLSTTIQPIPCQSGTYAFTNGSVACTPCDAGFYCPSPITKTKCPSIFYCPTGSAAALPCDPGLYSCDGSPSCGIPCPPGGYCPGNGTVFKCPLGTYSNGGAGSNCTLCEPGFFCDFTLQLSAAGCA